MFTRGAKGTRRGETEFGGAVDLVGFIWGVELVGVKEERGDGCDGGLDPCFSTSALDNLGDLAGLKFSFPEKSRNSPLLVDLADWPLDFRLAALLYITKSGSQH